MKAIVLLSAVLSVGSLAAEERTFERYQPIVDRQMFGQLPAGFDPTKSPREVSRTEERELTKEQEQLQSSIHFSVINITPDGSVAVGFTDNSDSKNPVHYYLKVGEKRNGWEVLEADPLKAKMTIRKGEIEVALTIGDNSAKTKTATSRAGAPEAGSIQSLRRRSLLGGAGAFGAKGGANDGASAARSEFGRSLRERRLAREKERQAAAAAAAEKAEQERAQREADREAQRQELQALREELKAQREAAEQEKAQREAEKQAAAEKAAQEAQSNENN